MSEYDSCRYYETVVVVIVSTASIISFALVCPVAADMLVLYSVSDRSQVCKKIGLLMCNPKKYNLFSCI